MGITQRRKQRELLAEYGPERGIYSAKLKQDEGSAKESQEILRRRAKKKF